MFKSGGYNVFPTEVENVIGAHPTVSEIAVVKAPDPLWSEVGVAFLVLAHVLPDNVHELHEAARSHLANYKIPKQFVVLDQLPKLPNGKPDRELLRQHARHTTADHGSHQGGQ